MGKRDPLHIKTPSILLFLLSPLFLIGCSGGTPSPVAAKPPDSFRLYKSIDHGYSWAEAGSGLSQSVRINSLFIAGSIAYAGTDAGIFISTDEGQTWSGNSLLPTACVQSLTAVGQQVFAGTRQAGVFRSKDSGRSWHQIAIGLTDLNVRSLVSLGPEVYAGTDTQGDLCSREEPSPGNNLGAGYRNAHRSSIWRSAANLFMPPFIAMAYIASTPAASIGRG